jgi:hypothetical protein
MQLLGNQHADYRREKLAIQDLARQMVDHPEESMSWSAVIASCDPDFSPLSPITFCILSALSIALQHLLTI